MRTQVLGKLMCISFVKRNNLELTGYRGVFHSLTIFGKNIAHLNLHVVSGLTNDIVNPFLPGNP